MMFKQEAIALPIYRHRFSDNLVNVGIGSVSSPDSKRSDHINTLNDIKDLVQLLSGELLPFFRVSLLDVVIEDM